MQDLYIREERFGKPFVGKTKNVVESYPKPMFIFNFEPSGLRSVKGIILNEIKLSEFLRIQEPHEIPEVCYSNYVSTARITSAVAPTYSGDLFQRFIDDLILILENCPFTTVVLDGLSGVNEAAIRQFGAMNPKLALDARSWAGSVGAKIQEVVAALFSLSIPVVVVIAHDTTRVNEITGETQTLPMIASTQAREKIGSLATHFLYATTEFDAKGETTYVVYTMPKGLIKGIGTRDNLPAVCGARFEDIYGKKS